MKNYYQILNIKPNASDDEIKRSYRALAKKYHPDVNPGDSAAASKFADINEAHDVLSDPKRRADYDAKVKEAQAPKPRPEDIIARQRAQAQAAARAQAQAAAFAHTRGGGTLDPAVLVRRAAQAQAQAQAAAQAQAESMQAQVKVIKEQAYNAGREYGKSEAKQIAAREVAKLNAEIRELRAENSKLRNQLADTESDRSDLEQELFNRDRELTRERAKVNELTYKLEKAPTARPSGRLRTTADFDEITNELNKAREAAAQAANDKTQSELRLQAQIKLQQDKRRAMQDEIDELNRKIEDLSERLESANAEIEQWQQYAKSEDFLSDTEQKLFEWEKKQKFDKKLAKPTLYGALGILIWATEEEITAAYDKLKARYSAKSDEESVKKLERVEEAYSTLSDAAKRDEYNASIGIDEERIKKERDEIEEYRKLEREYREQLDSREFWEKFDALSSDAQAGDAESQNTLGEMYYYGDEIDGDIEQAIYWFKEAAKQKHPEAMYNLGVCFVNGEGVDRNETAGIGFIRQAARLGSKSAIKYIKDNDKR